MTETFQITVQKKKTLKDNYENIEKPSQLIQQN